MKLFLCALLISGAVFFGSCKDECKDVNCQNGGTCVDGFCNCPTGYSGERCEIQDPCLTLDCQNGGTCISGACDCATGYEGTNCEVETRAKFIGVWTVVDNCSSSGNSAYTVGITNGSAITNVNIQNFWGAFASPVIASVIGNTITIATQEPENDDWSVSGVGTINGNTLSWNYTITNPSGDTDVCSAMWTK